MAPSAAEVVRRAAAKLREARFARICQYTVDATGERTSMSRGQVDFATGIADLELPMPGLEGSAAIVAVRPPHGYVRRPDGTWMPLVPVSSERVKGTLRYLESETLVATEREHVGDARTFDVRVDLEDAQLLRGTVWMGADDYLTKFERPGRGERASV